MEKREMETALTVPEAVELVERMVAEQARMTGEMRAMMRQFTELVMMMDARVKATEGMLRQRVTISAVQARALAGTVAARSRALCEKHDLDYAQAGRMLREAIWRALRKEYGVVSHYDLPAAYFDNAMEYIDGWSSFALIRKARERWGA